MAQQNETKADIAVIKSNLDWHFRIGSGAIVTFAGVLVWFFTSYLPKELEHQKADIITEIQLKLDQLSKLQLDKLSAQVATAKASGTAIDPKVVSRLGATVLDLANSHQPDLQKTSWNVANQLLSYYFSIVTPTEKAIEHSAFTISGTDQNQECLSAEGMAGIQIRDVIFENCTVHLDKLFGPASMRYGFLEFAIFRNAKVIYEGGPIRITEVYFVNCTFELHPSQPSQELARTLFAENRALNLQLP